MMVLVPFVRIPSGAMATASDRGAPSWDYDLPTIIGVSKAALRAVPRTY